MTKTPTTGAAQSLPAWLTQKQAAHHLAISERSVRRLISSGDLKARRIGKRTIRIDRESLLALGEMVGGAR